jgi:Holliday junction DNA helicase RuvA
MIASLKGKLISKRNNEAVLDVNGVGYHLYISKKLLENLRDHGAEYSVVTYLDVKENSLTLYGFLDEKEREMFKMLISVNGIGAKMAHNILSAAAFEDIISLISGGARGMKIPGLGSKKLELISMTLKDKIFKLSAGIDEEGEAAPRLSGKEQARLDALNALMNLGYMRNEAERIIREVLKSNEGAELSTEEIIKKSLGFI